MSEQIKETEMTDIQKMIEEEKRLAIRDRESYYLYSDDPTYAYREGYDSGIDKGVEIVLSHIQHENRWRKFSTDELPHIGQQIVCKSSSGRYHLSNPISHDGIHWLAENFIEWKPIE